MMRFRTAIIYLAGIGLTACSSTSDRGAGSAPAPAVTENLIQSIPPQGLPAQRLGAGECGMFLWGQTPPRRFIFFSKANTGAGLVLINEETVELRSTGAGGSIFGEFNTSTQFATADGDWSVDVTIEPGELLEDGQRIETGRIVLVDREGWQTILPVVGIRACIPG